MKRYKVIVPKLNVRKAPVANPADKSNIITTVGQGLILELEEATNVPNPSFGKWYKDRHNQFYWGGGLMEAELGNNNLKTINSTPNWMLDLRLPEIWKITTGKNIGVAVVDTGIVLDNPDLPFKDSFYIGKNCNDLKDKVGHGTHCAGLIGARNKNGYFVGSAPDCNLSICKISDLDYLESNKLIEYARAIEWCANNGDVKIVSISWSSFIDDDDDVKNEIQKAINLAVDNGKIILASRGNYKKSKYDNSKKYPACFNNVISVGIIATDHNKWNNYKERKDILVNGFEIDSYNYLDNNLVKDSGTSMSNAIMAGICALIIEQKGNHLTYSDFINIIPKISKKINHKNEVNNQIDGDLLYQFINS
ncbi:MAG: S8 family peptidase [Flavobacterium sp.]